MTDAAFETWLGFLNVAIYGENGHTWGVETVERLREFFETRGRPSPLSPSFTVEEVATRLTALRQLVEACERDFCSPSTEATCSNDESVGAGTEPNGEMAIRFGMIRVARRELDTVERVLQTLRQAGAEPVAPPTLPDPLQGLRDAKYLNPACATDGCQWLRKGTKPAPPALKVPGEDASIVRKMAACSHVNRCGGNDYHLCNDCGLMWDYRREGPQEGLIRHLIERLAEVERLAAPRATN